MGTGRQAYRKTRQARREEKKWQERKKKKCGFIIFGNESAAAGCDIPKNHAEQAYVAAPFLKLWLPYFFFGHLVKKQIAVLNAAWKSLSCVQSGSGCRAFLYANICVEIYTHPRISQSDFPVMHFVAL